MKKILIPALMTFSFFYQGKNAELKAWVAGKVPVLEHHPVM